MGEESSVVLAKPIYEHPEYLERLEEALKETKARYEKTKEELKKEITLRKYLESRYKALLAEYPSKREKKKIIKIGISLPFELWEKEFTGYGAGEKKMGIVVPIAGVERGMFASSDFFAIPELLQRQKVKSKVKSSTSLQNIFSTTLKSQSLTATASVTTIISLFALYYGFLRGYWALVGIGIMSLVVVFIDLWKASLRESREHERSAIKAY